jgi:hypothetical protein
MGDIVRIRSCKPEFWADELTGVMVPSVALFFIGMWNFADDEGRFRWDAALVRAALDPYDAKWGGIAGVAKQMDNLAQLGRLVKYDVADRHYGYIPRFKQHQKPNRPVESKLPAPPSGRARRAPSVTGVNTEDAVSTHGGGPAGEGVGEGEEGSWNGGARLTAVNLLSVARGKVRPDLALRWLEPLVARDVEGGVELEAPDEFHAQYVRDNCLAGLEDLAGATVTITARRAG